MQTDNNNTQVANEVLHIHGEWKSRNGSEILSHANNRLPIKICTTVGQDAKANAELICKAVNNYSKLVEENERLKSRLKNTHERMYAFLNEHDGLSDSDEEILRNIEVSLLAALNNAKNL